MLSGINGLRGFEPEFLAMCDYSLQNVASRPAKVGDRLVTTQFRNTITRGFAEIGAPDVVVCLLPGTEIAFQEGIEYETRGFGYLKLWGRPKKTDERLARFRQVNKDRANAHHDALELPGGDVVLVSMLSEGQCATVLQLPAAPRTEAEAEAQRRVAYVG
jgi:hypothetical protein